MNCQCDALCELWDDEARQYIKDHLDQVEIRADGWEVLYRCPVTGWEWLEEYPHSERQGGGPKRLRRLGQARGK